MTSGRSAGPRRRSARWVRSTLPSVTSAQVLGRASRDLSGPFLWPGRSADGHRGAGSLDRRHRVGDPQRLLDERLDDLRLRDGLDDLALDEDLALAVARRHAEVGLT